jgi:hypothetical protein
VTSFTGRFTPSSAGGSTDTSSVAFGADVSQEPVYLSARVRPSRAFARLMLTLGRVVRLKENGQEKDHSAYQEWVRGEYFKELPAAKAAAAIELPLVVSERDRLLEEAGRLSRRAAELMPPGDAFWDQRRAFWKWLYTHNRDAWMVLDPIVSVQRDATFFEAFSQDESIYARVRVPSDALETDADLQPGTTNIDFSVALERELSRTRSYRPLHLTVGASSVGVTTNVSSIVERKIDLPDTWVRGLVEVQAALALAPVEITLSSGMVADVIARIESQRERIGPRALLFRLVPGQPVSIEVQPWGETFVDPLSRYDGGDERTIKVWGRRRLGVLADLLPHVDTVTIHLVDSGMPTFWSVTVEGIGLTIGLSGWSSQDWAGRARFSAMIPASMAEPGIVAQAAVLLRTQGILAPDDIASELNVTPAQARAVLQRLCVAGKAMYDPDLRRYRWRALFPQLDLEADTDAGREERMGVELSRKKSVTIESDELSAEGVRRVTSRISDGERESSVVLESDIDGRVTYAQCDCSHFRYHKLRQGPCRHIVATNIAEGAA